MDLGMSYMNLSRRQFIGLTAGLGISTAAGTALPAFAEGETLRFVAINDIHVKDQASVEIVIRAVTEMNSIAGLDFVVVVGDLGTDGTRREMMLAESALERLRVPYFSVPGNYDYDLTVGDGYANYDASFGRRQWQVSQTGWAFLGLDTCNETVSEVTIPDERMAWLEQQLKGIAEARPIALFAHHPFNPNTLAFRVRNAEEVMSLFGHHNLRMVISGHYHGNQIEHRDGVLFTTTSCCSTTRANFDGTREKGFRYFELEGPTIRHRFVEVRPE